MFSRLDQRFLEEIRNNTFSRPSLLLSSLELNDADVTALVECLKFNTTIEEIILANNLITDAGVLEIANLEKTRSIRHLDLSNNQIGPRGAFLLAKGRYRALYLNGNTIGNDWVENFVSQSHSNLVELGLRECSITDSGARKILTSKTLKFLDLGINGITGAGLDVLPKNTTLRALFLDKNPINDVGIDHLVQNKYLEVLNLTADNLSDLNVSKISEGMTSLRELWLDDNRVGDLGARALARHPRLEKISLDGNEVGMTGALNLSQSTTLKDLTLAYNRITGDLSELDQRRKKEMSINLEGNPIIAETLTFTDSHQFNAFDQNTAYISPLTTLLKNLRK